MTRGFTPSPLPAPLSDEPFAVASARASGITRARLRAVDLDATIHGVRAGRGSSADLRMRCRMFAARLPAEVFFSHQTAALLHEVPLPRAPTRLHVTTSAPHRAPHAAGLVGHSRFVAPGDVVLVDGIRVSSPTRMFLEVGQRLALPDLVAVADHLIRRGSARCSIPELVERLEVGDRLTRRRVLREALALADPGAESRPESVLRILLRRCGLGTPVANLEVRAADGRRMRIDIAFPEIGLAVEYHGDYHRDREQWRRDLGRRSRLEALGWTVVELTADDLLDPDELVARIRAVAAGVTR